jgi:nickel-dependent lactate racemase
VTELEIPYGATTLRARTRAPVTCVRPLPGLPVAPVAALLDAALERPVGTPPLEYLARPGDRVTVIISDATRDEPRGAFLAAVRARLPAVRLTVAIATGTHGPVGDLSALGVDLSSLLVVDHDGQSDLVEVGTTSRGTPVRVHRCAVEADLVVATGVIRPHYFAGWGAGAKAIFPGLAESAAARINHRWKTHPSARAGAIDDNPCRLDLEEAARLACPRAFLLNGLAGPDGSLRGAVAGDLLAAFRAGAALAAPWSRRTAARSSFIIVSDQPPVTDSLYQASKLVAAVADLLLPGGTILIVAPCPAGIGPLDTVNQAIYDIGLRPRLPGDHQIQLLSDLPPSVVAASYARSVPDLDAAIAAADQLLVVGSASKLILDVVED